ncbi:MAG: HEAT repeat domain-containing protein [Lentisphaerota bacterium]
MNRRQFQAASEQARRRAVELGESGDAGAVDELMGLCKHAGPTVRRAAASALGKLSNSNEVRTAVPVLCELARDSHPQVRQYAILSLGKIGDDSALPVLRDISNRPSGPDYVLAAALKAIEQIDMAVRIRLESAPATCSRCGKKTTSDERRLSENQFQRVYCSACFDVYIEYWGMDTTDYKIGMLLKQKLFQQEGKMLISLYPADMTNLDNKLADALRLLKK